jgi:pilus assembly protein CpaE
VRSRTPFAAAASAQRGQASVELLGVLPLLVALGLAALQLLAVGYAGILAGSAAEAGALALAGGSGAADARAGVREALPGWSRARTRVTVEGGRVTVRLRPPALLEALAERLEVAADASVEAL